MTSTLLFSVVTASLIGSVHCAGMCGPIVLLLSTGKDVANRTRIIFYHLGRLVTYMLAGAMAGFLGQGVDKLGNIWGWQRFALYFASIVMLLMGLLLLMRQFGYSFQLHFIPETWQQSIRAVFRHTRAWPTTLRALAIGMFTIFLPCGWLYAFVIIAGGTGNYLHAMLMMLAFWLGTVPLLTILGWGIRRVETTLFNRVIPWISIGCCFFFSLHLLIMNDRNIVPSLMQHFHTSTGTRPSLDKIGSIPLPCCEHENQ